MSEFTQYVNERWARERKITAAREAVIAAARAWSHKGKDDRNTYGYTPEDAMLEQAVYSLDRLEATDQAGAASPRAPEVQDAE